MWINDRLDLRLRAFHGTRQHACKDLGHVLECGRSCKKGIAVETSGTQQIEGAPGRRGRVMKTCLDRQIRIVNEIGIEGHGGACRRSAEQVHYTTLARHPHSPLPCLRRGYRFKDDIRTTGPRRKRTGRPDDILNIPDAQHLRSPKAACSGDLIGTLDHCHDLQASEGCGMDEEQTNGTGAQNNRRLSRPRPRLFQAAQNTRQWLGKRCMLEGHIVRHGQRILFYQSRRKANKLRIGAIVEQKIVTKILLADTAKEASVARC